MWRAIISSSLVGITQTETRLEGREMRRPLLVFAAGSISIPSHDDEWQIRLELAALYRGETE